MRILAVLLCCLAWSCTTAPPATDLTPSTPETIVSVVPSATEMLFALGVGNKIIAIGDFDQIPAGEAERPRIGGLLNPNIEKIIELRPDLVVTYGTQDVLRDRLGAVGIRLYPFTHGSIDQTLQYMIALGETVGAKDQALAIEQRIRKTFDEVRAQRSTAAPKVLLIHNRAAGTLGGFYSVGAQSFQHELMDMAGGVNLFADVEKEVVQPGIEEIIARGPDIIIETLPSASEDADIEQRIADWKTLSPLPAVLHNRIHIVREDYMLVPGPRLDLAARQFAEIIQRQP